MLGLDLKETQAQVKELLAEAKKLPKGSPERLRLLEIARIGDHFADLMEARGLPDDELEPAVSAAWGLTGSTSPSSDSTPESSKAATKEAKPPATTTSTKKAATSPAKKEPPPSTS